MDDLMTDEGAAKAPTTMDEQNEARLGAARHGDEGAFEELFAPHRAGLHALCYRMLGSVDDADDVLQDVAVKAWRGLAGFEGRASLRTWLYRIATNACLNRLTRQPARTVPLAFGPPAGSGEDPGPMLDESLWLGPYPGRLLADDESSRPEAVIERLASVELAFVTALQTLSPQSRAVLILRSVLDYSAQETADLLGISVPAVNSSLQRARASVRSQVPSRTQQETLRELGEAKVRELVEGYAAALADGDVEALLVLLHQDATWCMPPMPAWYQGREAIAGFLSEHAFQLRWHHLVTSANGQPAVGCYSWDEDEGVFVAAVLDILTLRDDKIAAVTAFVDPDVLRLCGLPDRLPESVRPT
jgi:RNA polymerase sigma-70 factor (ECF subfamily)